MKITVEMYMPPNFLATEGPALQGLYKVAVKLFPGRQIDFRVRAPHGLEYTIVEKQETTYDFVEVIK